MLTIWYMLMVTISRFSKNPMEIGEGTFFLIIADIVIVFILLMGIYGNG